MPVPPQFNVGLILLKILIALIQYSLVIQPNKERAQIRADSVLNFSMHIIENESER